MYGKGYAVIKSFKSEREAIRMFQYKNNELEATRCKREKIAKLIEITAVIAGVIVQIGMFFIGSYFAIKGEITIGVVLAFVNLMNYILLPIQQLPLLFANRKAGIALIDKFVEYAEHNIEHEGTECFQDIKQSIAFENLSFGYEENQEVLKNINIQFDKNKSYAIVGASGSGKSTLLNLLLGSYSNYDGNIYFDNKELKAIKKDSLYDIISMIQQNVFLFDASIIENISMFKEFDRIKLDDAIERAGLSYLIQDKSEVYRCGESGINLSGGERQRISIARCLLKNSSVLLMDEATAALDNETAFNVTNAILNIDDLTRIIVTHKLDKKILERFDEIIVLKNGHIEENGNFENLFNNKAYFYSLYNIVAE